jgi:hypothetical protein
MKAYIERQENSSLVYQHRVSHFFSSLNEEQLSIIRDIISSISGDERLGGYYGGITTMLLVKDHGYCMACGGKHDDELARLLREHSEQEEEEEKEEEEEDRPSGSKWSDYVLTDETSEALADYRVNLLDPPPQVACRDCGMIYPSLEDRMLKPPDYCSGCFSKAAHG